MTKMNLDSMTNAELAIFAAKNGTSTCQAVRDIAMRALYRTLDASELEALVDDWSDTFASEELLRRGGEQDFDGHNFCNASF